MNDTTRPEPAAGERVELGIRGRRALEAAKAGLYVFPLYPGTKNMPAVQDWENEATRDPEKIAQWWSELPYNLAVATSPSRLVVVDLDRKKPGAPQPEAPYQRCTHGRQVLAKLAAEADGPRPWGTYSVVSPSQGMHLYFRAPDGVEVRNSQSKLGPLVDVRGKGGYIVAATSWRRDGGGVYRALNDRPIAPLPTWLLDALLALQVEPEPVPEVRTVTVPTPVRAEGDRVTTYVEAIVEAELRRLQEVPKGLGRRHKARLTAALKLGSLVGGGHLTRDDARARLLAIALTHVGTTHGPDGRPCSRTTRMEVVTTIDNGLDHGARNPREITQADLDDRR